VRTWLAGIEDPVEVAAHVTAGARVTGLKLVLDEGLAIEGHVFGPDGNPVEHASLRTSRTTGTRTQLNAETDAQGRFRMIGLVEGAYDLSVFCWDEHSETRFAPANAARVPAGSRDVIVRLRNVARIEGFVREVDGTPVPVATVIARVGGPGGAPIAERGNADGSFFVDVAEGDVADLEAHRPGETSPVQSARLVGVKAGTKNVELRLPPR
jgi:hypothetical protein